MTSGTGRLIPFPLAGILNDLLGLRRRPDAFVCRHPKPDSGNNSAKGSPLRVFATGLCHGSLPRVFATGLCHGSLPRVFATGLFHGTFPRALATGLGHLGQRRHGSLSHPLPSVLNSPPYLAGPARPTAAPSGTLPTILLAGPRLE